jgi:hypothetical protein
VVLFHSQNYRTELEIERRLLAEAQQAEIAAQLARRGVIEKPTECNRAFPFTPPIERQVNVYC